MDYIHNDNIRNPIVIGYNSEREEQDDGQGNKKGQSLLLFILFVVCRKCSNFIKINHFIIIIYYHFFTEEQVYHQ